MGNIKDWQELCIARYEQYPEYAGMVFRGILYDKRQIIAGLKALNSLGRFVIAAEQYYFQAIKEGKFKEFVIDSLEES